MEFLKNGFGFFFFVFPPVLLVAETSPIDSSASFSRMCFLITICSATPAKVLAMMYMLRPEGALYKNTNIIMGIIIIIIFCCCATCGLDEPELCGISFCCRNIAVPRSRGKRLNESIGMFSSGIVKVENRMRASGAERSVIQNGRKAAPRRAMLA